MPKTITFDPSVEVEITCDSAGAPSLGNITFIGSNRSRERVSVGPGTGFDVDFSTLRTSAERTAFRAVLAAAIAAGRVKIGDV